MSSLAESQEPFTQPQQPPRREQPTATIVHRATDSAVSSSRYGASLLHASTSADLLGYVWSPASWMGDLQSVLARRRLCHLRMVGSHDSATYGIGPNSDFAEDAPGLLDSTRTGCLAAFARVVAKPFSSRWAVTQHHNILEQLQLGVRYLDLRLVWTNGQFYTTHGQLSVTLNDVVRQIGSFYQDARSTHEVLVIDVQHLFGFSFDSAESCGRLFHQLAPLESLFIAPPLGPGSTLGDIWATRGRILLCVGADLAGAPSYAYKRCQALRSRWLDQNTPDTLIDALSVEWDKDTASSAASPTTTTTTTAAASPTSTTVVPQGGTTAAPAQTTVHHEPATTHAPQNKEEAEDGAPVGDTERQKGTRPSVEKEEDDEEGAPRGDEQEPPTRALDSSSVVVVMKEVDPTTSVSAEAPETTTPPPPPLPPSSPTALQQRSLYVTQAILTAGTSDVVRGILCCCCCCCCGVPSSVLDYACELNPKVLGWFRDLNLRPDIRSALLRGAANDGLPCFREEHDDDDDDGSRPLFNTHGNVLLLDYVEEGLCEWDLGQVHGSPTSQGRSISTKKAPSFEESPATATAPQTVAAGPAAAATDETKRGGVISIDAVTLCVFINLTIAKVVNATALF